MNFNELYPKKKEYYHLLMDIKTTAECNVSNCIIDKQKAKLLMRYLNKKDKEIEKLNNIISELERYLEKTIIDGGTIGSMTFWYRQIYDYLQELKGNDNENNK